MGADYRRTYTEHGWGEEFKIKNSKLKIAVKNLKIMERNNQEFKKKLIADSFGFSKRVIQTIGNCSGTLKKAMLGIAPK